ncbi:MAG TPA: hypothetical protein PLV25_04035, partial [Opitutales bacterium]|nr:hypothetical protein [Opitutales bacterium]
ASSLSEYVADKAGAELAGLSDGAVSLAAWAASWSGPERSARKKVMSAKRCGSLATRPLGIVRCHAGH